MNSSDIDFNAFFVVNCDWKKIYDFVSFWFSKTVEKIIYHYCQWTLSN